MMLGCGCAYFNHVVGFHTAVCHSPRDPSPFWQKSSGRTSSGKVCLNILIQAFYIFNFFWKNILFFCCYISIHFFPLAFRFDLFSVLIPLCFSLEFLKFFMNDFLFNFILTPPVFIKFTFHYNIAPLIFDFCPVFCGVKFFVFQFTIIFIHFERSILHLKCFHALTNSSRFAHKFYIFLSMVIFYMFFFLCQSFKWKNNILSAKRDFFRPYLAFHKLGYICTCWLFIYLLLWKNILKNLLKKYLFIIVYLYRVKIFKGWTNGVRLV